MDEWPFAQQWRILASDEDDHVRAIAGRLCSEPLAMKYFPYASHSNVHLSRNDTFPWEGDGLPFISVLGGPSYQAHDGDFRIHARGDLETAVRAFLELLDKVERIPNVEARRNAYFEKTLKRCHTLLSRWNGADGAMHELTASIRTLRIDLHNPGRPDYLRLSCLDAFSISGPVRWPNANIEVSRIRLPAEDDTDERLARLRRLMDGDGFLVRDADAHVEVFCGAIEVNEHVSP